MNNGSVVFGIIGGVFAIIFAVILLISSLVLFFISVYTEFPNENGERYVDVESQRQGTVAFILAFGCLVGGILGIIGGAITKRNKKRACVLMSVGSAAVGVVTIVSLIFLITQSSLIFIFLLIPGMLSTTFLAVGAVMAVAKEKINDSGVGGFKKIDDADVSWLEKITNKPD